MSASLIGNPTTSLLEKAAIFGERRHEILAGNIANISNLAYRNRDLPVKKFQEALQQAVAGLQDPPALAEGGGEPGAKAAKPKMEELFPPSLFQPEQSARFQPTTTDARKRMIEIQTMKLTKNAIMQNYLLEMLRAQMMTLQSVISERVA